MRTLVRAVAVAAPVAERLPELWRRGTARLWLMCHALTVAVPAASCTPPLSAMVRRVGGWGCCVVLGNG